MIAARVIAILAEGSGSMPPSSTGATDPIALQALRRIACERVAHCLDQIDTSTSRRVSAAWKLNPASAMQGVMTTATPPQSDRLADGGPQVTRNAWSRAQQAWSERAQKLAALWEECGVVRVDPDLESIGALAWAVVGSCRGDQGMAREIFQSFCTEVGAGAPRAAHTMTGWVARATKGGGLDWSEVPLGRLSDHRIALALDVTRRRVVTARKAAGIPAMQKGPIGVPWDSMPLGQRPDSELAEMAGTSIKAVQKARRRRGISAFRQT